MTEARDVHALDQTWPSFLDELDRNPERAAEGFCRFAMRLLRVQPPGPLRSIPFDEREDVVSPADS